MKRYSFLLKILIVLLLGWLFVGCSASQKAPTPSSDLATPTQVKSQEESKTPTKITIDGDSSDWEMYQSVGTDSIGDQAPGSPDLGEAWAFNNDKYFYLLVRLQANGQTDHYDIIMDGNGGDYDYQLSVWPDTGKDRFSVFPIQGEMALVEGVSVAQGEVIEIKMPLSLIGDQPLQRINIQTYLGNREGDQMPNLSVPVVSEIETLVAAAPTATLVPLIETHITIDGQAEDWTTRPVLLDDPSGDAEAGFLDLTSSYAFVNQNALYFLINVVDPKASFVNFDLELQADDKRLLISWKPGNQNGSLGDVTGEYKPLGAVERSTFAFTSALEGRVDLADMGSPESLNLREVRVMVGECCQQPSWHTADVWKFNTTPRVNEFDPPRLASDDLKYTLARRFHLPEGYVVGQLYAPPAPDLTGISRSINGVIYLQHGGLNPGVSILDTGSGKVTHILDLPPAGAGYHSLVGGPDDTALIPVGTEIWQVHPDGSYDIWGNMRDGWPQTFTNDGRLLGRSMDETQVIELFPNGSSRQIAAGFSQIYDIVASMDGTIFISDFETGNITRVNPDGSQQVLAEHVLFRDPLDMALDSEGNLFLNSVTSGFVRVDRDSGVFTRYEAAHSPCTIHQSDFEFSEPGRAFFIDPTWSTVTWVDLKTGENGMFISNQGSNTWAAAIGADDALYVGAWGCSDQTPAQVIRLADDGTRQIYVDGLTGQVTDVSFGPDGTLYISTFDSTQGKSTGYRFSPENNEPVKIYTVNNYIISLTVDPLSNNLLATARSKDYVLEFKSDGSFIEHRIQLPMAVADFYIDTAPDGKLYAYGSEAARQQTGPVVERWVLGLDLENGLSEKIFQFDRQGCCVMGNLSVDPQGLIWWVVDPENIIYQVTPDGKNILFAQNLPIDPAAAVVDRQGDLYFTSPSGIYRIYLEK